MEKRGVSILRNRNFIIAVTIIIFFLVLVASGTKIYLYANTLLGNDVIVRLTTDKDHFTLTRGEEQTVKFQASVNTNPFCSAKCTSKFIDIGRGTKIEDGNFTLRTGFPLKKDFTIKAPEYGEGQLIYRFSIECYSESTTLCHTTGKTTARDIIITAEYTLNEEEKQTREEVKQELDNLTERLEQINQKTNDLELTSTKINEKIYTDGLKQKVDNMNIGLVKETEKIFSLNDPWEKEDFKSLEEEINRINKELANIEKNQEDLDNEADEYIARYNNVIDQATEIRNALQNMNINPWDYEMANQTAEKFNALAEQLKSREELVTLENITGEIMASLDNLFSTGATNLGKKILQNEIDHNLESDALCAITGICTEHITIKQLAEKQELNYDESCARINKIRAAYTLIKPGIQEDYANQGYPATQEFSDYTKNEITNLKQDIIRGYLAALPPEQVNTERIVEIIKEKQANKTVQQNLYQEYNLTATLTMELIKQQPAECTNWTTIKFETAEITTEKLQLQNAEKFTLTINFGEPKPQCCFFEKCTTCCENEECKNDPKTYPIIMIHGHAFNKGLAADYGLDGYNKLQRELENDGYLNAGILTLYTKMNNEGELGEVGVPITVKGSYYFDVYQSADNPVEIQTKSENIDTYAIRLKEMIDILKYKTGKPKVILVGYSMGGLVARRYVQIFGEQNIEKLILIGTPNHGVKNRVADLCPFLGESLECRDLTKGSLFLNKLNSPKLPNIQIYNIVGTGCDMDGEQGDGIVTQKSAMLEGVENYMIKGKCGTLDYLHTELYDTEKYPETYKIIKQILKY